MEIAIIGGGASGLLCAYFASQHKNVKITLFEKNSTCGKKLLLSGSGQCNITHFENAKVMATHYNQFYFSDSILKKFDSYTTMKLFENMGIPLIVRPDNKVFPKSLKAKTVLETLVNKNIEQGVTIKYNTAIHSIEIKKEKFLLNGITLFDKVVLATGG
jgi:predicted Rossmann fold flavoprotein